MIDCIAWLRLAFLAEMLVFVLGGEPAAADEVPERSVLILSSENSLLPATQILVDSIVTKLQETVPANLSLFTEFMDSSRRARDPSGEMSLYLATKYAGVKIDLVLALGPKALELLRQDGAPFATVPVVFAGIRRSSPVLANLPPRMGGVTTEFDLSKTVDLARALQPNLQRVVVVTGASAFDRAWRARAETELAKPESQIEIIQLAEMPLDQLLKALREVPPNSAVLYLSIFRDGNGSTYVPRNLVARIVSAASAPVYSVYPTFLGDGIVGGHMMTFEAIGEESAAMALPFLLRNGAPAALSVVDLPSQFQVDWRAVRLWNFEEARLPVDTIVHHRQPSFWRERWLLILAITSVLVAQAAMIMILAVQKRRRLRTERSLRQANEHMEIASTSANLGLWSWSPAADQIWLTPHCRRMIGLTDQEEASLDLFLGMLAGRKADAARTAMLEAVRKNGTFHREFRLSDAAGRARWLSATGHCTRRQHEFRLTGTLVDVSDRKVAEIDAEQQRQQVIHLTRVAVLGELSGALAHELNQPLTAILSNAQTAQRLIGRAPTDLSELQEILVDIVHDDHRAGAILSKLRSLIRKEEIDYVATDLNQIVEEVLALVHSDLIERRIQVVTELAERLPPARADRIQIQQVLLNLVRNACDAMEPDRVEIRKLVLSTKHHGSDGLTVTVADNGKGLPEDLKDRVFEPFVTTKPQGMGLGLAICRSILAAHGGRIWYSRNPSGGTTFEFCLPVLEESLAWAS